MTKTSTQTLHKTPENKPHHAAHKRCMDGLQKSEHLRAHTEKRASRMAALALRQQNELAAKMPGLRKAVAAAKDDDAREKAHRAYLQAVAAHHRCEQVYQRARRQQTVAEGLA